MNYIHHLTSPVEKRRLKDISDLKLRYAQIKGQYCLSPQHEANRVPIPNDMDGNNLQSQSPIAMSLS